jgi:PadR family transcriptional regulator, regulatory protein PadR
MTMREQTYLVLLALADGPLHGYAVLTAVSELSAGSVTIGPGTLYGALDRLVAEELIEVSGTEVVNGRHRRYYRLTSKGGEAVSVETARLSALAVKARRVVSRLSLKGA